MQRLLILKLLICLLALCWRVIGNYISIDITVNNTEINTLASYTFSLVRDVNPLTSDFVTPKTVPLNSVIQFVFPNDYATVSSTATVPCTDQQTGLALVCQVSSATKTVTVTNYYTSAAATGNIYPTIKIGNILNPSKSGQTGNFVYYIRDSSGIVIDQSPAATNTIYSTKLTFTPGRFTSCRLSAQSATILTRSRIIVSISPKNPISSSGKVVLEFPLSWNNDIQSARTVTTTPSCSAVTNTANSLSCSFFVMGFPINKIIVTVTGLSASTLSSDFSFSIQSVLTPPVIDSSDNVGISSQASDNSNIDTCQTVITDLTPIMFQMANFQSTSNTLVQSQFIGRMSLSIAKPFSFSDTIVFTLPQNFLNGVITSNGFSSFSQSRDSSSSSITLSNFPSTSSRSTGSQMNFTFNQISNPTSVRPLTLIVSFYRLGSLYQQSTISYSAIAATATSFKILPVTSFVNARGSAQVEINTNLGISTGGRIKVSYPSTVISENTDATAMTSSILNGISVTSSQFRVVSNTIIFDNIFQSTFTSGIILLNFSQFQNPPTIQPSHYILTVQTSDGFTIFTGSTVITSTLRGLIKNQITSSSLRVLENSVLTASLELNFAASMISIIVPSDILIRNGFETTCLPNSLTACYLNGNNLTFEGNFQPGVQTLTWGNVQNPNSFQPTRAFSIFTYNRGWGVQRSLGFIFLQMSQTSQFTSILAVPSTQRNNEQISVNLAINFPSNSPVTSTLTVIFPSDLDVSSSTCNITCIKISNNITFEITSWVSSLQVTVSNVLNAPSFKPIGDFVFWLINADNYQSLYQTRTSWTNNLPSSFITDVSTGDAYRNQNALFKFKLTQLSSKQTHVIIRFSDLFAALTVPPTGATLSGPRSVRFDIPNQANSDLGMTLQTPVVFGDYTFSAQTYIEVSNISYLISQSISNVWRHSCFNTVCKRCNSADTSVCIDCYDKAISDFYIFDTSQQTCTRDCTTGFFLTTGNICSPCSNNCLECANVSTNCTSCSAAQSLFLDTNFKKCVTTCEDGYYKNNQVQQCLQCSSPCLHCVESATRCTHCPLGRFLLNRDCLQNCPTTKLFIQNTATRNCDTCNVNCLTCENMTTTCLSCNVTALQFLENKRCVSQCQSNSFPSLTTGECVLCKSPCNVCFNDSTVCSTCISTSSTPIWFNYGCITVAQCPIGNFINTRNSSCDTCKAECATCTSLDVCTTCNLNFALHQGNCITNCPNTTYVQNRVCMPCTGCLTCSGNYTECTSCISSQFLFNGKCFTDCPNGAYKNTTTRTCQLCTSDCPTCMNTTFCLTCISTLNLYLGRCLVNCPLSTFPTISSQMKVCQACPSQCSECTSLSQCQKCVSGFSLQNDTSCVLTCSKGISFNQVCYPCGLNCSNCQEMTETCQLCDTSFYLYEKKCLSTCPSTTLSLNGLSCVSCSVKFGQNCTTCETNNCLSCSDGELVDGQCRPCSEGTYTRSSKCAPCPSQCRSCMNQTFCFSCAQNYFMEQNYCVNVCPLNKIPNGTACTFCMDHCSICNLQNSLCSVCSSGFYLYESRCLNQCPNPLVINLDSTRCVTQEQFYVEYSQAAKIVYFPFSIAAGIMFVITIIIKCYSKMTHLATLACAVLSIMEIGSWAAFTYVELFAYMNFHFDALKSFALMIIAIGIIVMIAIVQTIFYCKYLKSDEMFLRWERNHWCTDKLFLVLSVLLNFKLYRIVHSRLLERQQFSMRLMSLNKLMPFSLLSIISLAICSLPVIVGAGLALYFSIDQDQEFFAALDCVTVTSIMGILILLDLRHESTYFVVQFETQNLKRQIYEVDSLKFSVNQEVEQKDASKGELFSNRDEEFAGQMAQNSGQKLRGQSDLVTTGFNQTNTMLKKNKDQEQDNEIEQIDIDNQQIEFYQESEEGDQAIPNQTGKIPTKGSQKHLMSDQQNSQQSYQPPAQKWVRKQFDRHGYMLKTNEQGEIERYDQNGYRVEIDQNGQHIKYDKDGNKVEMFMGQYCVKDKGGYFLKDGKRYDKRGYEVREDENGEVEFYDKDGFRVVEGEDGSIKLFDQHGFEIIKDQDGNIHRMNEDGYEAFISPTGKVTFKDKEGNFIRKTAEELYEMYDPQDGFKIVKNQQGIIKKFDKLGYRIEKDKWGNIYRYDDEGYRVVLGPGDKIARFDKDGYEVIVGKDGQVKRFNKQGYEMRVDANGKKRMYEEHGYEVVKDYDGEITLFDSKGYQVVIDEETRQHRKYNSEGLRVVKDQNGEIKLFDKRGRQVVEFENGLYEKYDENGNRIELDLFGYEVEHGEDGELIRYDKVGDVVDEELFEQKLQQEERLQSQGLTPKQKLKRFKPQALLDLEGEYSKMVLEEKAQLKDDDSGSEDQPKLLQFHDVEDILEEVNFEQQLTTLRNHEQQNEILEDKIHLNLDELHSVDHTPQLQLRENLPSVHHVEQNLNLVPVQVVPLDQNQQYVELKSIADVSVNERSFENEGVQPIHHSESQCSELESMDELSPNLALRTKRGRGQRSEMSFANGENTDTKTQYNHKTVNVQIKQKNPLYDQNEQVQSLNQQNWAEQAQNNMFYRNYNKDLSNANTNTNMNELIFMEDVDQNHDTLSSFVREKGNFSQKNNSARGRESSIRKHNSRYDKNTIEEMENELFEKELDDGIKERREFILSNKPNPLVEYARKVQANKKSLQQKMYLEEVHYEKNKKKRRK